MTNCVFYAMFFVLFLNMSFGSLRYSQINRVFTSIYKGMVEASTLTINESGEPTDPYYSPTLVDKYVTSYLDKNVSRYATNYSITTTYLSKTSDAYCTAICRKLSITLEAEINVFYKYKKTQIFEVKTSKEL